MDRVGPADRRRRRLGQTDVADLALRDQLRQRTDGLFDRRLRVDAVLVVEVDVVGVESPQRSFYGDPDVRGRAVEVSRAAVDVRDHAELGGQNDLVAPTPQSAPDQLLVRIGAVDLCRIDEGDAQLQAAMDGRDGIALVDALVDVGGGHPHRPQPDP